MEPYPGLLEMQLSACCLALHTFSIQIVRSRDSETRHSTRTQPHSIRNVTLQKLRRATMEMTYKTSIIRTKPVWAIYTTNPTRIAVEIRRRLIEDAFGLVLLT